MSEDEEMSVRGVNLGTPSYAMTNRPDDSRCGDYYARLDVVCTRWTGHGGLHRTELTKDDDGVLSGVEWGRLPVDLYEKWREG